MRRFAAFLIALMLLPITACTDSSMDSVDSTEVPEGLPDGPSSETPKTHITAEGSLHEHGDRPHSSHGSHATSSQQHRSHDHQHEHHQQSLDHQPTGIAIGDIVPDFEVTIDGMPRRLNELQKDANLTEDGTLMLTFWCSFCHSCRDVEADLDRLATKYKGRVGVIALDASAGETMDRITEFARNKGLSLPIALNPDGAVADMFGITTTTTTVLIDSKGVLRYRGRFHDDEHAYADNAIVAVLAGRDVLVKETAHRG